MDEIAAKDDAVNKWVSQHKKGLMLPFTDVKLARKVEEDLLPRLQEKHSGLSKTAADYYLLAWGKVLRCPVVTLENKIPKVGMEEDVKCMNLFAFMRQQGWEF